MLDTVIVPLDGSATAEVALPYAQEVSGRTGAELDLIFVREPNDYRSENIIQCYLDNTAEKMQKSIASEQGGKEVKTKTLILTGNPAEEIINYAEKQSRPHIIMATHGQSGANTRWSLGSVADKVVRATTVPVGIIRSSKGKPVVHEATHLSQILAPLDGSKESESTFKFIKDLAAPLNATVTFLEVNSIEVIPMNMRNVEKLVENRKSIENYLAKITQEFQKSGIQSKYVLLDGADDVASQINRYTEENNIEVVIMATHGRSGPRRWVLGSVADKVMREGNTPLVLIRTPGPNKD